MMRRKVGTIEGFGLDRRHSIADQVYARLKSEIVALVFSPGDILSETDLGNALRVSRTPIRQAIKRLSDEGFVESVPQYGTIISYLDIDKLMEAQFMREALECALVRRAAGHAGANRHALGALLAAQEAAASEDLAEFYALDQEFHRLICEMAGLPGAWKTVEVAASHLSRVRRLSLPVPFVPGEAVAQHQAIVDALVRKDPDAAEAAMRAHVRNILKVLPHLKKANEALFEVGGSPGSRHLATRPEASSWDHET